MTSAVDPADRFPVPSRTSTTGCVVSTRPETAPAGWVTIPSAVGGDACTSKLADSTVTAGAASANRRTWAPASERARFVKVARPPDALTVSVPESVPAPDATEAVT